MYRLELMRTDRMNPLSPHELCDAWTAEASRGQSPKVYPADRGRMERFTVNRISSISLIFLIISCMSLGISITVLDAGESKGLNLRSQTRENSDSEVRNHKQQVSTNCTKFRNRGMSAPRSDSNI